MNRGAGLVTLIAMLTLAASPGYARLYTSSDWNKLAAELKTLPPDFFNGAMPQPIKDEALAKMPPPASAPTSWTILKSGNYPAILQAVRQNDRTIFRSGVGATSNYRRRVLYDPLGLVVLADTSALSVSAAITQSTPVAAEVKQRVIDRELDGTMFQVTDRDCAFAGSAEKLDAQCRESSRYFYQNAFVPDGNDPDELRPYERPTARAVATAYRFDAMLGLFVSDDVWADAADWKIGDAPWHSATVSAALTPAQKDQARALFARGFDLYKSGDLTGARALVESGLKTDPGNYLGWFTLGQIGRSTVAQNPNDNWGGDAQLVYYQHTIDLAPDSPEAALAKGYLAAAK